MSGRAIFCTDSYMKRGVKNWMSVSSWYKADLNSACRGDFDGGLGVFIRPREAQVGLLVEGDYTVGPRFHCSGASADQSPRPHTTSFLILPLMFVSDKRLFLSKPSMHLQDLSPTHACSRLSGHCRASGPTILSPRQRTISHLLRQA